MAILEFPGVTHIHTYTFFHIHITYACRSLDPDFVCGCLSCSLTAIHHFETHFNVSGGWIFIYLLVRACILLLFVFFWHALSFSWKTAAASLELTLLCSGLAWLGNSCEYSRLMVIKPYVWFFGYSSSHILEGEKFYNVIFSLRERELINHLRVYFNYLSMIWKVC